MHSVGVYSLKINLCVGHTPVYTHIRWTYTPIAMQKKFYIILSIHAVNTHRMSLYVPGVHSPRLGEGHRELGATLHLDHAQAGQRVNLGRS